MIYTGIGARLTPQNILDVMFNVGKKLAEEGWILRSGGAKGADDAFERGCLEANGKKEIYLPWKDFNGRVHNPGKSYYGEPTSAAHTKARALLGDAHWDNLSWQGEQFHSRNMHQVMGLDLKTPTNLVVCWTENWKNPGGGTATAIKYAKTANIPINNLANPQHLEQTLGFLNGHGQLINSNWRDE